MGSTSGRTTGNTEVVGLVVGGGGTEDDEVDTGTDGGGAGLADPVESSLRQGRQTTSATPTNTITAIAAVVMIQRLRDRVVPGWAAGAASVSS